MCFLDFPPRKYFLPDFNSCDPFLSKHFWQSPVPPPYSEKYTIHESKMKTEFYFLLTFPLKLPGVYFRNFLLINSFLNVAYGCELDVYTIFLDIFEKISSMQKFY